MTRTLLLSLAATSVLSLTVAQAGEITVIAREFRFEPDHISVVRGEPVVLLLKNEGVLSHNLAVPELKLQTDTVQTGATGRIEFVPDKTGSFAFRCLVPGHTEAGMKGELVVSEAGGDGPPEQLRGAGKVTPAAATEDPAAVE